MLSNALRRSLTTSLRSASTTSSRTLQLSRVGVASSFSTSSVARSDDHGVTPQLFGPGAKPGTVATDLDQATGLERFELMNKLQGEEAFDMKPLKIEHMGTPEKPVKVWSLDHHRIVGCTGFPVDSHDTLWLKVPDDGYARCIECGCCYQVDYHGLPDDEHGHGHH